MTTSTTRVPSGAHATTTRRAEEPPTPHVVNRRSRTLALGLLVSAQFVVMLDPSIANVALPSIQSALSLSTGSLSWVVNAYVLTLGGLLLLCGRVADQVGRRRTFTIGSALFIVGTLVAACAGSEWMLVAGRVVQGAGAACLSPAAMSLLLVNFPGEHRAGAMSRSCALSSEGTTDAASTAATIGRLRTVGVEPSSISRVVGWDESLCRMAPPVGQNGVGVAQGEQIDSVTPLGGGHGAPMAGVDGSTAW